MKILYLVSWFRAAATDTVGSFFAEQAATFSCRGHEVAVAHCEPLATRHLLQGFRRRFKTIERLDRSVSSPVYRSAFVFLPRAGARNATSCRWQSDKFLTRVLRDFGKPDVVHIQSTLEAGIHSFGFLLRRGIPYVLTEHATFFRRGIVPCWKMQLVRDCFKHAHYASAVSQALVGDLRAAGVESEIEVVPNTYDDRTFFLVNDGKKAAMPTFLVVCYLNTKKGIDVLLRAFATLRGLRSNARLLIAGDGPERTRLQQLAAELSLKDHVSFLGAVDRQQVAHLMQQSHCLVSSSRTETFGVTLLEAMACGLPVVATRSGGPEEFVCEPYGRVVAVGDTAALGQAMSESLLEYDDGYHIPRARSRQEYVSSCFGPQALYNRLLPIYRGAAAGPPAPMVRLI